MSGVAPWMVVSASVAITAGVLVIACVIVWLRGPRGPDDSDPDGGGGGGGGPPPEPSPPGPPWWPEFEREFNDYVARGWREPADVSGGSRLGSRTLRGP